ncbi:glycosyltransferase family 2 protein [bacterium]|nr:glycosyltransferase family 2 protein [bacterium]
MKVTVGIPFHNNEDTLGDAIRSVFAQTFEDWELILVDDGSTDSSLHIASAVQEPRIRVIHSKENRGLPYRLNQISRSARGQYIARMDADDIMHPRRLACQAEYLDANPDLDVVGAGTYTIDMDNAVMGKRGLEPLKTDHPSAIPGVPLIHPTVMGRARWFVDNPYDEGFLGAEDYELWCGTIGKCLIGKLQCPLHFYRENNKSPKNYLRHYLKASNYQRRAIRKYGLSHMGFSRSLSLMIQSYLKDDIYRIATILGAQRLLFRRRNLPLSQAEQELASRDLCIALNAGVPGFAATTIG